MTMQKKVFDLIKLSLWGTEMDDGLVDASVYEEMKKQAIFTLPAGYLSSLNIDESLKKRWKRDVIQQISFYVKYQYEESRLPLNIPYVILKGSAAAKYYPHQEYRCMGDIDIMTKREDYQTACDTLLENGWKELTNQTARERGRHQTFWKNGITIEVHAFFASMNDVTRAKKMDDLIIENITSNHYLPDQINGLVLIEHINQHMEDGIGLRQIIDWMMYASKCLTDEGWKIFYPLVKKIGLDKLAITITRMCELYLGLEEHQWSADADQTLCSELIDYIVSCGNFGNKIEPEKRAAMSRLKHLRHPIKFCKKLQDQRAINRTQAKKPWIRSLSYLCQGIKHMKEIPHLVDNIRMSNKLDSMFEELNIKREDKELVYYENGKYYKKR